MAGGRVKGVGGIGGERVNGYTYIKSACSLVLRLLLGPPGYQAIVHDDGIFLEACNWCAGESLSKSR